jgi:hypothetical protein
MTRHSLNPETIETIIERDQPQVPEIPEMQLTAKAIAYRDAANWVDYYLTKAQIGPAKRAAATRDRLYSALKQYLEQLVIQ